MVYNLTFKELLNLCSSKIMSKAPKRPGSITGAFNGGNYLGRPGKDIYFALSKLNEDEMNCIIEQLSHRFPHKAPKNHVGYAACIRYLYGQFEKQGILRSQKDLERMQNEDINWKLPRKFMFALRDKFIEQKNYYGLCIFYEMEAHRLGDEGFLNNDISKIAEMESCYMESVINAYKCKSLKQMFTPYYWAFRYFARLGKHDRALEYALKTLEQMEKHCPSDKHGYLVKAKDCVKYLRKHHKKRWKKVYVLYKKTSKNVCVRRALKK